MCMVLNRRVGRLRGYPVQSIGKSQFPSMDWTWDGYPIARESSAKIFFVIDPASESVRGNRLQNTNGARAWPQVNCQGKTGDLRISPPVHYFDVWPLQYRDRWRADVSECYELSMKITRCLAVDQFHFNWASLQAECLFRRRHWSPELGGGCGGCTA
ncbi:hypothetical protein BD779DRAFT_781766 [Infundibulicybe gibba]|nr:hypothetical protein BD779DRAFT_781766 [Infundibulicybe gibba]